MGGGGICLAISPASHVSCPKSYCLKTPAVLGAAPNVDPATSPGSVVRASPLRPPTPTPDRRLYQYPVSLDQPAADSGESGGRSRGDVG